MDPCRDSRALDSESLRVPDSLKSDAACRMAFAMPCQGARARRGGAPVPGPRPVAMWPMRAQWCSSRESCRVVWACVWVTPHWVCPYGMYSSISLSEDYCSSPTTYVVAGVLYY